MTSYKQNKLSGYLKTQRGLLMVQKISWSTTRRSFQKFLRTCGAQGWRWEFSVQRNSHSAQISLENLFPSHSCCVSNIPLGWAPHSQSEEITEEEAEEWDEFLVTAWEALSSLNSPPGWIPEVWTFLWSPQFSRAWATKTSELLLILLSPWHNVDLCE